MARLGSWQWWQWLTVIVTVDSDGGSDVNGWQLWWWWTVMVMVIDSNGDGNGQWWYGNGWQWARNGGWNWQSNGDRKQKQYQAAVLLIMTTAPSDNSNDPDTKQYTCAWSLLDGKHIMSLWQWQQVLPCSNMQQQSWLHQWQQHCSSLLCS